MEWELKELREELYASNAINNPSYDEYKNKWVFYDAYENGWSYIYVLGVVPDDYLCFYGYGVDTIRFKILWKNIIRRQYLMTLINTIT